ncbi:Retinoic acid induced 16-like protein-domain-containing protein [Vararia minispora EC-137]|uniref:Retinoic acid induced 16-like protein-domain-containing protein n=1 Tax=Vararia minispora EC-137 TaxID=1314806 RepID=A0ACB8QGZ4_9AGAM|nr:Retinoic acid induced 16-like protein-domain-containing protein [Vararia minispora EC-137]
MDYFSKFLRPGAQPAAPPVQDHVGEFHRSWMHIKNTLLHPDERQLTRGIKSTDVPAHLQTLADLLVSESTRAEEGATGQCLEYLLKNDVLGTLVRLSETDRPFGIQAEVLRTVQNMVILMDEQFLVHSAVHKAVLRLLRNCVGDDLQEQLDNRSRKVMGAAGNATRTSPSEYEEDLVNLLCILCSRIRTFRELLMIFFHDKHWFHSEPLFAVEEEEEDDDDDDEEDEDSTPKPETPTRQQTARSESPVLSQTTTLSAAGSSLKRKSEYEFLLFNYLLRFVHREGKIGEFARAGLLFLMDVAMSPNDPGHRMVPEDGITSSASSETVANDPITEAALSLAEYILDGDFSEVLAAGLGAVYSLLPSKLEIKSPKLVEGTDSASMVLGSYAAVDEDPDTVAAIRAKNQGIGKEESTNPDFKSRLDHFLKLLEFLEDIFRRNVAGAGTFNESTLVGSAIVDSILDAVRRVFMENILYPSILECSDVDGSAVAVMSYIDVMIRTLEHGQLADVLVNFLMTEDNDDLARSLRHPHGMFSLSESVPPQSAKPTKAQKLRRRRSSAMVFLEMDAPDARRQSEYFTSMSRFTLKDLLRTNLRSKDEPTAATALQLLQSLLYRHNSVCVERLLLVSLDPRATCFPEPPIVNPYPPSPPADDDESEKFVYPGSTQEPEPDPVPPGPIFAQPNTTHATHEREMGLYLNLVSRVDPMHVSDAFSTGYECYLRDAVASIHRHISFTPDLDESTNKSMKHRLNPNDPLLTLVLEWLRRFLSNKPESNIALTGTLATLAYDPNRSLAGWLTFGQTDQHTVPPPAADTLPQAEDDGDDRSIDCDIERRLASEAQSLPASSMNDQTRPVVFTILQGLVGQLERYRQIIDDFDKYLSERRQGLLFSENLTDALALAWDLDDPNAIAQLRPASSVSSQLLASPPKPKPAPKKSNSLVSFLTPRKSKPSTAKVTPSQTTTSPNSPSKNVAASPFGSHYQHTGSIVVEPFDAPLPDAGPWTPARSRKFVVDDDDVFSAGWGGDQRPASRQEEQKPVRAITLSQLLDNVVILEESIKELVAIVHARKSLGIDGVRYV